jgi:sulfatase maturation enzyme AslB (radical SAM superfamily)
MSDTFCIMPFKKLCVSPHGGVRPCSAFNGDLKDKAGIPLSVYTHSLEEIFNSEDMQSIRRDMVDGKKIPRCWQCYEREEAGYLSTHSFANGEWAKGWLNEEGLTFADLKARAVARDFREVAPSYFLLVLATLCNLKCRMCPAENSSSINRDPIHSRWAGGPYEEMPAGQHWRELEDVVGELFSRPQHLRALRIYGGEPLIIKEVGKILQFLVDAGVSHQVEVEFSTNATATRPPWLKLFGSFKKVSLTASIDGFEGVYEYIRFPAKWETVKANLEFFRNLPNTTVVGGVAVQAYNALNLVELFRYFDEIDMPFSGITVISPSYLRTEVLPPRARQLAIKRLRTYVENDCKPQQQEFVHALIAGIESYGDDWNHEMVREFMLFTNDLDTARGQSIRQACPEVYLSIVQAGHPWNRDTVYAKRLSLPIHKESGTSKAASADAGPMPAQSLSEISLPLVPAVLNDVIWNEGVATCEGLDPFLVFPLAEPTFVQTIRVACTYIDTTAHRTRGIQMFWRDTGRNDFTEAERTFGLQLWPEPREKVVTIQVADTIDQFRIDPDSRPCVFKIHKITLLARTPAAQQELAVI